MEDHTLEPNTDELENLEEEVKLMAGKIAEFRATLPQHLKDTLASIMSAQRPPNLTRIDHHSDPGPSCDSNLGLHPGNQKQIGEHLVGKEDNVGDVRTRLDSEDLVHTEKVQTIKQKISNNASAMPLLVERMKVCISRIDKLDSFKQDMIHPAFTRKRSTS